MTRAQDIVRFFLRKANEHLSLRSVLLTGILSIFSLASYVYSILSVDSSSSRESFFWVIVLQAIAGATSTFVSVLCAIDSRAFLNHAGVSPCNHDQYIIVTLILLIWLFPSVGTLVSTAYVSIISAIIVINGASTLQMPIYIVLSLSYSFQLIVNNPQGIELLFPRIGLTICLCLMASLLDTIPSLTQLLRKSRHVADPTKLAHAACLSLASSMNVALPVLVFGNDIYSQLLNLGSRVTFVCETILTGKILHRGDISYAHSKRSPRYIAFVAAILVLSSFCAIGLPSFILKPVLSGSSAFGEFRYVKVSMLFTLSFAVSLISVARLFYAFSYYKLANVLSGKFYDGSRPRISVLCSCAFLVFLIIYFLSLQLASHWAARVLMLILPQVVLLVYLSIQLKYSLAPVRAGKSIM